MNYLAHLYLAENDDAALVGNLLGDFVKGRLGTRFDSPIYRGIRLHRAVDRFTDAHPIHRRSRQRFSAKRRRYAGIIVDMAYDHFLARHWSRFRADPLDQFAKRIYAALYRYHAELTPRLRHILPYMVREDWLTAYRDMDNVGLALDRLSLRLSRPSPLPGAVAEIRRAYGELETDFMQLLPELEHFTKSRHESRLALSHPLPYWLKDSRSERAIADEHRS